MATKTASSSTDLLDKQMLNLVQSRFPMSERPYAEMAEQLGTSDQQPGQIRTTRKEHCQDSHRRFRAAQQSRVTGVGTGTNEKGNERVER